MLDQLVNTGVFTLNDAPAENETTVIVVGPPRSGTSMVAATLRELGMFMGDGSNSAVFEDVRLAYAIEKSAEPITQVVTDYNMRNARWAFKRPMAFSYIESHLAEFRNPRIIVTFRDPLAVALREHISMVSDLRKQIERAAQMSINVSQFALRQKCPTLLVSYEKAMSNPLGFVQRLSDFCGLPVDQARDTNAAGAIKSGPEDYLKQSQRRFDKSLL